MNAKDWIKELQSNPDWTTTEIDWEAVDEIERKLKAFEIIKKKKVEVHWLSECLAFVGAHGLRRYNACVKWSHSSESELTKEEYNLLKEVLK